MRKASLGFLAATSLRGRRVGGGSEAEVSSVGSVHGPPVANR
jgi:hypothetical protein